MGVSLDVKIADARPRAREAASWLSAFQRNAA